MRRLPTTLTKLTDAEQKLKAEADALAKKRAALARQREKMERTMQEARWMAAGRLMEQAGLPIADLDALEQMLKILAEDHTTPTRKQTMSTTANVPFAEKATTE